MDNVNMCNRKLGRGLSILRKFYLNLSGADPLLSLYETKNSRIPRMPRRSRVRNAIRQQNSKFLCGSRSSYVSEIGNERGMRKPIVYPPLISKIIYAPHQPLVGMPRAPRIVGAVLTNVPYLNGRYLLRRQRKQGGDGFS